jgi:hypothetical protein
MCHKDWRRGKRGMGEKGVNLVIIEGLRGGGDLKR